MSALLKILMVTSPILAIVLYLVMVKMEKHDIQIEQEKIEFTQKQDKFHEDFDAFLDPVKEAALADKRVKERQERDAKAKEEEARLQTRRAENDRRSDEFSNEFEKAMKELETEKTKGGSK